MVKIPGNYQYRALTKGHVIQRFWHDNKLTLLKIIGEFSPKDIVLDAGCGSGNISFYLAGKVSKVVGLDINKEAISFAGEQAKKLKLTNATFKVVDLKKIPFKENYFTKVILFEVVEHLSEIDYQKILFEIYRVMKRGGLLYLTTPNKISLWPIIEFVLGRLRIVPPLKGDQHILELTPSEVKKMMIKNKFKLREFGSINHFSPFICPFSWILAKEVFSLEVRYLDKFGPTIWLVAEK